MKLEPTFLRKIGLAAVLIATIALTGTGKGDSAVTAHQINRSVTSTTAPGKWEYRIIYTGGTENCEILANRLGEQGFEMIVFEAVLASTSNGGFVMVFRRPKP